MVILLDYRPVQYESFNGEKARFIMSCASILFTRQGVEWLFLVDKTYKSGATEDISAERVISRKAFPGKAGWKLWYGWQVPRVLKKYKPDLFITTGDRALSGMQVPQYVWGWGEIAPGIEIERYAPVSLPEREKTKLAYAEGKEYFLALVPANGPDGRIDLLKSFSLFKKRQKSNMQLVFLGKREGAGDTLHFARKLETYKFRQDIHMVDHLAEEEEMALLGASYGFIFLSHRDSLGIPVLKAWAVGIPVIMDGSGRLPEMAGDAALYVQSGNPTSLASQLMSLYKDEGLRNNLVRKGKAKAEALTWDRSAEHIWADILGVIGQKPK